MITLEKEKVTINPDIKVIKRDGRMVVFDSSKIYEAILKASEAITPITPLIEAKLEGIANRIVAEIGSGIKVKQHHAQYRAGIIWRYRLIACGIVSICRTVRFSGIPRTAGIFGSAAVFRSRFSAGR